MYHLKPYVSMHMFEIKQSPSRGCSPTTIQHRYPLELSNTVLRLLKVTV